VQLSLAKRCVTCWPVVQECQVIVGVAVKVSVRLKCWVFVTCVAQLIRIWRYSVSGYDIYALLELFKDRCMWNRHTIFIERFCSTVSTLFCACAVMVRVLSDTPSDMKEVDVMWCDDMQLLAHNMQVITSSVTPLAQCRKSVPANSSCKCKILWWCQFSGVLCHRQDFVRDEAQNDIKNNTCI